MSAVSSGEPDILANLADGLVLRRARFEDRETLATFHANTLLDFGEPAPADRLYFWILDLMSGAHPIFRPGDFTLVEDTTTGKIVSSVALISLTWTYEGIPFKFGQPDIVSTDPAYRRRGLVRAQFDVIHRWSAERGELVQGITGIPWYYRQFGYEMALSLGGSRASFKPLVPRLSDGASEPYVVRPATAGDVPFIMEMDRRAMSRSVIASRRDEALWRFDIAGRSERSGFRRELRVIERAEPGGEPVGVVQHSWKLWGSGLGVTFYELAAGVPFLAVTPGVMRYLDATGDGYAARDGATFDTIAFYLGEQHPVYDTIPTRLPHIGPPYAWFIRVPDLPAFVRHIAPALERRLAASPQAGYTGELRITFYRSGLRLDVEEGRISVHDWMPERIEEGDAAFPDLTFLKLLFGYRSLDEIQHLFPDCAAVSDDARALLPILFPKKTSEVWVGG